MAFVHYGYTVKYVSGRSMQVRAKTADFRLLPTDVFFVFGDNQPTLNPDSSLSKDLVLFDRVSTKIRHEYNRDDVVALQYVSYPRVSFGFILFLLLPFFVSSPINPRLVLVKRIIALPGDTVGAFTVRTCEHI
jgi:hypothetical protein